MEPPICLTQCSLAKAHALLLLEHFPVENWETWSRPEGTDRQLKVEVTYMIGSSQMHLLFKVPSWWVKQCRKNDINHPQWWVIYYCFARMKMKMIENSSTKTSSLSTGATVVSMFVIWGRHHLCWSHQKPWEIGCADGIATGIWVSADQNPTHLGVDNDEIYHILSWCKAMKW